MKNLAGYILGALGLVCLFSGNFILWIILWIIAGGLVEA
jgi:hypothetical protein